MMFFLPSKYLLSGQFSNQATSRTQFRRYRQRAATVISGAIIQFEIANQIAEKQS